ncbi:RdgB/HAM1 family non-canonical purine NTP pyrophosphatase [Candidatus Falkowbacteria bacterium]|nr:RdgB/HAM1 family non-canonical purine NTP pyrophosphatase [Candidatus Falkowbacteria bacterium]
MKLIFATHNPGKLVEMKNILSGLPFDVLSADEAGVFEDVEEDGKTFVDNAFKKARFVADKTGEWAIADDSGIMIDALSGRPGVFSARWAGENAGDDGIVAYTLEQMKDVPSDKRTAYFVSAAVLCGPKGERFDFEGKIKGKVLREPRGKMRPKLPYDVIFEIESLGKTFAELTDAEKNAISHRGKAFKRVREFLERRLT